MRLLTYNLDSTLLSDTANDIKVNNMKLLPAGRRTWGLCPALPCPHIKNTIWAVTDIQQSCLLQEGSPAPCTSLWSSRLASRRQVSGTAGGKWGGQISTKWNKQNRQWEIEIDGNVKRADGDMVIMTCSCHKHNLPLNLKFIVNCSTENLRQSPPWGKQTLLSPTSIFKI